VFKDNIYLYGLIKILIKIFKYKVHIYSIKFYINLHFPVSFYDLKISFMAKKTV